MALLCFWFSKTQAGAAPFWVTLFSLQRTERQNKDLSAGIALIVSAWTWGFLYLLTSHWPKKVTWPSLTMWQEGTDNVLSQFSHV